MLIRATCLVYWDRTETAQIFILCSFRLVFSVGSGQVENSSHTRITWNLNRKHSEEGGRETLHRTLLQHNFVFFSFTLPNNSLLKALFLKGNLYLRVNAKLIIDPSQSSLSYSRVGLIGLKWQSCELPPKRLEWYSPTFFPSQDNHKMIVGNSGKTLFMAETLGWGSGSVCSSWNLTWYPSVEYWFAHWLESGAWSEPLIFT